MVKTVAAALVLLVASEVEAGQRPAQRSAQDGDQVELVLVVHERPAAIGEMAADEACIPALDEVGQDGFAFGGGRDADVMRRRFRRDRIEPSGSAECRRQPLANGRSAALRRMEECDAPSRLLRLVDMAWHARAAHQLEVERPQHMLIP